MAARCHSKPSADRFEYANPENLFVVDDAATAIRDYASQG